MKGYRTYLMAAGVGIIATLYALGLIDDELFHMASTYFTAGSVAFLRAGVKKTSAE